MVVPDLRHRGPARPALGSYGYYGGAPAAERGVEILGGGTCKGPLSRPSGRPPAAAAAGGCRQPSRHCPRRRGGGTSGRTGHGVVAPAAQEAGALRRSGHRSPAPRSGWRGGRGTGGAVHGRRALPRLAALRAAVWHDRDRRREAAACDAAHGATACSGRGWTSMAARVS